MIHTYAVYDPFIVKYFFIGSLAEAARTNTRSMKDLGAFILLIKRKERKMQENRTLEWRSKRCGGVKTKMFSFVSFPHPHFVILCVFLVLNVFLS